MCLVIHLVSLQVFNALYKCYVNNLVSTSLMVDTDVVYITMVLLLVLPSL
jgi:hypothetical protein